MAPYWRNELLFALFVTQTAAQVAQPIVHRISFAPTSLTLTEWSSETVHYNLTLDLRHGPQMSSTPLIEFHSADTDIVRIVNHSLLNEETSETLDIQSGVVTLQAAWLGRTHIEVIRGSTNQTLSYKSYTYPLLVVRAPRVIDAIFDHVITVIVVVSNFMFGCMFDVPNARQMLRRPVAPAIGLVCQYAFMPSCSYLVGWALQLSVAQRLGLLGVGCSPGGLMSNIWSLNLDGDVTLSIVMTFVSSVCALFMMPLWLLTLGQSILGTTVTIPFLNVFIIIAVFIVPIFIGIGIAKWKPSVKNNVEKIIRPFTLLQLIITFGMGFYCNWYALRFAANWRLPVSAMLLPYTGFLCGTVAALAFSQGRRQVVTIGIETAFQNTAIALVVLKRSLPQPEADIAAVQPIGSFLFTPLPLVVAFIVLTVKKARTNNKKKQRPYEQAPTEDGVTAIRVWETPM